MLNRFSEILTFQVTIVKHNEGGSGTGNHHPPAPVRNARCPKELKIYTGCGHCGYSERKEQLSYIADWMSAKLQQRH
jgi:hypothetical protein